MTYYRCPWCDKRSRRSLKRGLMWCKRCEIWTVPSPPELCFAMDGYRCLCDDDPDVHDR